MSIRDRIVEALQAPPGTTPAEINLDGEEMADERVGLLAALNEMAADGALTPNLAALRDALLKRSQ